MMIFTIAEIFFGASVLHFLISAGVAFTDILNDILHEEPLVAFALWDAFWRFVVLPLIGGRIHGMAAAA